MGWFSSNFNESNWYEVDWFIFGGSTGFPSQYAGLRIFDSDSIIKDICLVLEGDAPVGMGGVLKINKNENIYSVYLVETSDPYASNVRIQTSAGIKAWRIKT